MAHTSPSGVAPHPAIVLDVWSDLVSPWCYLAKARLRSAIDAWERPAEVLLRHRAFELDPGMPRGGGPAGGSSAADTGDNGRLVALAAAEGVRLDLASVVPANTFDAHRLIALGRMAGGPAEADAILERLFSAHLSEGLAIDDHAVLLRCAAEASLDERRVSAVLAGDDYADEVRADEREAARLGATTVPFVLGNGRVALSGTQPIEAFTDLLRESLAPRVPGSA